MQPDFSATSVIILLAAYFLGSIPFGVIFSKLLGTKDLRAHGSGNIGATNAFRVGGKGLGILTLVCDALKGATAVMLAVSFVPFDIPSDVCSCNASEYEPFIYGASVLFVVMGHVFPIWLKFKGGKGVATYFAAMFVLRPISTIIAAIIWAITFSIFRISAVASIFSVTILTFLGVAFGSNWSTSMMIAALVIILFRHIDNVKGFLKKRRSGDRK